MDQQDLKMDDGAFLNEHLDIASVIAREAAKILLKRFGRNPKIEFKGEIDIVTDADRASEKYIVSELTSAFPGYSIMTEESSGFSGSSPFTWVMDPLDGTTNFAHGFPFFCVSIALVKDQRSYLGIVYDPVRDELFTAIRGGGSFLNSERLAVSKTCTLNESLLATGFPYDIREGVETNLDNFAAFAVRAQAIRRAGSAALDLCYVAAGRFDGYWEISLHPWDMAAGTLIAQEAGGLVTDLKGHPYNIKTTRVVASNGIIHSAMLEVISEVRNGANPI